MVCGGGHASCAHARRPGSRTAERSGGGCVRCVGMAEARPGAGECGRCGRGGGGEGGIRGGGR